MINILLADLAHTHSVDDASLTVPLGLGYLKAYGLAQHGDRVAIHLFKHPERLLAAANELQPDIVGFANYGWNENLNLAVGGHLRKMLPGTLFMAGGPNIDPGEQQRAAFLKRHNYLDLLIVDGGEEPFSDLIDWWRDDRGNLESLPMNIVRCEGNEVVATSERKQSKIIKGIESPYLGGHLDEFLDAGMVPMFESNRGCPFKCTFCAWGSASKNLVRRFDVDITLAEIDYVGYRTKAQSWIFCDANFGILKRDVELAKAIRKVRDDTEFPKFCHIWLAKNVTERNLEIGGILADMAVPVMAVQSLDDAVLRAIKRDNISTDTYVEYQQKFHQMGSQTYSDLIVPLPNETLSTHLDAIRQLMTYGVDKIICHNMRLLAGAESNSPETREKYGFRTKYRLIHGDAGAYKCPDGTVLRCFEYEESLRQTSSMTEDEMFFLRKLHFMIDFFWNVGVYKPFLKLTLALGGNPVRILMDILRLSDDAVANFFEEFTECSNEEWFESAESIEEYFFNEVRFDHLLDQEYEKLNIMFGLILLRDYKPDFDKAVLRVLQNSVAVPQALLEQIATVTQAMFQGIDLYSEPAIIHVSETVAQLLKNTTNEELEFENTGLDYEIRLSQNSRRSEFCEALRQSKGRTLSKIMDAKGFSLSDLGLNVNVEDYHASAVA